LIYSASIACILVFALLEQMGHKEEKEYADKSVFLHQIVFQVKALKFFFVHDKKR